MTNAKPSAALLRTAAAALVAAAAVASCSSDPARVVVPAPASSTPATPSDTAAADPTATAAPGSTPTVAAEKSTVTTAVSMTDTEASTTGTGTTAGTTLIAVEPSTSDAEPALAPVTTAIGAGTAAPSWEYSPLENHLSLDAVNNARMQAPNPAVIRIPRLDVEASIIPLGLNDDGSIEVPEDPDQAGWWLGGPEPGETGPAVILGHVDSQEEGPAVFFYLQYLDPGDEIHIDRVDGSTITYVVESTERHDKDEFPTDAVYGPTEQPTLRLVTCGGDFDFGVRTYQENVIVFASLA